MGAFAIALAAAAALTGCSNAPDDGAPVIRFALDWTPNTNHTGLYVALAEGWFAEAGVEVEILPYSQTAPDQVIDAGQAEAGISFHNASVTAQAAGAQVVTVMAVLQHWATAIGVRADDERIDRPADLDGMTYAGFGSAHEEPTLAAVIRADGGEGEFETVTLDTMAYEALYSGDVDVTIPFFAWEGIEAERRGTPMRYFHYTDYGFPDAYAVVVNASRAWTERDPEQVRAFVGALQRGYAFAADNPDEAARILLEAEPEAFGDPELVTESQRMLSAELLRDAEGRVGALTLEQWAGYGRFLFEAGILAGPDGQPLRDEPDWSTQFTTDFLSEG